MTAFLKNLIGRSRGTLEVVQPRIPSIYEPYRRGDGLLGTAPGRAVASAEPGHAPDPDRALYNRPNPSFRTSSPVEAFDGINSSNQSTPQPSPILNATDSVETAWPSLTPHRIERPPAFNPNATGDVAGAPDASGMPTPAANSFGSTISSASEQRGSLSPAAIAGSGVPAPGRGASPGANPLVSPQMDHSAGPHVDSRRPLSSAGLNGNSLPVPPLSLGQPESAQQVAQAARIAALLARQASSFQAAVRPPLVPRAAGMNPSGPSIPSLPNVEVSIGKVEVRAVFPEQAARPAPARRARPTVSLDDYLNQRHRGKR